MPHYKLEQKIKGGDWETVNTSKTTRRGKENIRKLELAANKLLIDTKVPNWVRLLADGEIIWSGKNPNYRGRK